MKGSTIDSLNAQWNELRNAALGRGVTPLVTPELAKEVADQWDSWRVLRSSRFTAGQLNEWVLRYNDLRERVDNELKARGEKSTLRVAPPAQGVIDMVEETLAPVGRHAAATIGIGIGVAVLAMVFSQRRR